VRATYDTSGNRTAAYLAGFGFGEVLARVDGAEEYALRDRLGSTVGWVGQAGLSDLVVRDAYGVRGPTAVVVPFGYTGHAEDPTGLVWGRARCMAPRTGAWTSEDSIHTEPRYLLASGVPDFMVDADGRSAAVEFWKGAFRAVCFTGLIVNGMASITRVSADTAIAQLESMNTPVKPSAWLAREEWLQTLRELQEYTANQQQRSLVLMVACAASL
jgi:RHS repeat-associated protein